MNAQQFGIVAVLALVGSYAVTFPTKLIIAKLYGLYNYPNHLNRDNADKYRKQRIITQIIGQIEFMLFFVAIILLLKGGILGSDATPRDIGDRLFLLITGWYAVKTLGYEARPTDPRHEVDETSRHYIYVIGTGFVIVTALLSGWLVAGLL